MKTTFTGPVVSKNGFIGTLVGAVAGAPGLVLTGVPTSALPPASAANAGGVMLVIDNGVSNNEWCLVLSDGTKWTTVTGQPLT